MKQFWLKVLQRAAPMAGLGIGFIVAEWLWKHIVGR